MIHFSLFSGIGGFELAAEWMGWKNYVSCEIDDFCNKVRKYYWPDCWHHDNVKTLTFELINEKLSEKYGKDWRTDDIILTGGFPCQPYSSAGNRFGKEDERHLWPHMLRAIQEIKPTYVVGENVRGITNWNGGVVFEEVCVDLENSGYEVQPILLPACSVGAPHRRDRVWFVAYSNKISRQSMGVSKNENIQQRKKKKWSTYWNKFHLVFNGSSFEIREGKKQEIVCEPPLISSLNGFSEQLDGITFSEWVNQSNGSYGNAIVPQLAFIIFQTIVKTKQNEQQSTGNRNNPCMD